MPAPVQISGKDSEHLPIGLRIRILEQALIFHLLDYGRQHLSILLGLTRPHHLQHLPCAVQEDLLVGADQFSQTRAQQGLRRKACSAMMKSRRVCN